MTQVILIVATPGNLQAGLQALLTKLPDVETLVATDERSTLRAVERHNPALVILDYEVSGDDYRAMVRQIKGQRPTIRCLVLVDQVEEREDALENGADAVLIKGYPALKLIAVVEELMAIREIKDYETLN